MKTELAHVELAEISVSSTNKMFRDESELQSEALQELIDSIKQKGVIQPILLRPGKKGYELVCGERRFRASKFVQTANKDRNTIPAYIRDLTDQEALELQIVENLQRKDVHPLKEAKAYQLLIERDKEKNTVANLALQFGKSETYILQRLKLNDLVPEIKQDYQAGCMTLGHALLIANLMPADQLEIRKELVEYGDRKNKKESMYYQHVYELKEYIDENITNVLSSAQFKKDDATLLPKAGACTTCPKRTGSTPLLFQELKNNDRCLDRKCFQMKCALFQIIQIKKTIEEQPDIILLKGRHDASPEIEKLLKDNKIKVLTEYNDFNTYDYSGMKKFKGMWISGHEAGKMATVYSAKEKATAAGKKKGSEEKINVKEAVARIKERTKRAAELDDEKVYIKVIEALQKHDAFKLKKVKPKPIDEIMLGFTIFQHAGYGLKSRLQRMFKLPEGYRDKGKLMQALGKLKRDDLILMNRIVMLEQFSGQADSIHGSAGQILYKCSDRIWRRRCWKI